MARLLQDLVGELYKHTPFYVPNQALLVQQRVGDEIFCVGDLLRRRGYQIHSLGVEECTGERVLSSVDKLARNSRDDSKTFFYYAGHGHHIGKTYVNGISVRVDGNVNLQRIVPYELFERLGKVRGRKAIIIDACLSGEFIEELSRYQGKPLTDYVLITVTTREGLSTSSRFTETKGTPLEGRVISSLVYWMYRDMRSGEINLANIPIPEVKITEGALRDIQEKHPEIDVQRIDLRIQRASDTDFII